MLPIQLKLSSLKHCYIQLPQLFLLAHRDIKAGAIIAITSVQNDHELIVTWNGQFSAGEFAELDLNFGLANKFKDELVVISLKPDIKPSECSSCRVRLLNNEDYSILSQHIDINLLDGCKLISKGLVISLWVSQNVSVLVEVLDMSPASSHGYLTEFTEMQYEHSLVNPKLEKPDQSTIVEKTPVISIKQPIPFLSCSLGYGYKTKFCLGSTLVYGDKGSGKTFMLKDILDNRYKDFKSKLFNCKQLRGKRPESVKKILNELFHEALQSQPYILALDDIDAIVSRQEDEKGQEAIYKKRLVHLFCSMLKLLERSDEFTRRNVVVIATARSLEVLDEKISKSKGRNYFNQIIKIESPTLEDRKMMLKNIIEQHKQIKSEIKDDELELIARRCTNYKPVDLRQIVERSIISSCSRSLLEFTSEPLKLNQDDLLQSIEGYTPTNLRNVTLKPKSDRCFEDIGGMDDIKQTLLKTILLQIKYPNLFKRCPLKTQSSILLYGPPGCGKTLIAEALTNKENLNSICVRGPELLSKYIGASEGAVRELFAKAELARPCVIFFDEFESLVSKRGSDSTGVTDRIVNQFLTLMDGVEKLSHDVFIIAASSRPDMIDPAILRPGRLDKHIYCPLPDQKERLEILRVLGRKLELDNGVNLEEWSKRTDFFTGADLQALLYSAQLKALHELIDNKSNKQVAGSEQEISIAPVHLEKSFNEMMVTVKERYDRLISRYPRAFRKASERIVATRATLL